MIIIFCVRHAEGVRQHGAQRSEAPKRKRSPQHADLVGMSAANAYKGTPKK
ncbi:MAG: hypothetical protein NZ519_03410 [Bacteroidia bacterium]|nr:hypothetical protein [Bacteroidia bacterium]